MTSECDCPITTVALGCVFGTLGVIALVIGLIILVRWSIVRRNQHKPAIVSARRFSFAASIDGVNNEAYEGDDPNVIMMMSTGTNKSKKKQSKKSRNSDERGSSSSLDTLDNNNVDVVDVTLTSRVGGGFGFDISGNNKDGIAINNVHERGPAKESKLIEKGDKIVSLTISFNNMVYEDALTLLSYANPYPVILQLAKKKSRGTLKKFKRPESQTEIINEETEPQEIRTDFVDSHLDDDAVESKTDPEITGLRLASDPTEYKSQKRAVSSPSLNGELMVGENEQRERPSEELEVPMAHVGADNSKFSKRSEGENSESEEDDSDDDTQRVAPSHLPANIRNIVESKKAQSEAVNNVQIHSRQNSRENILLSPGATAGLELILNGESGFSDTTVEKSGSNGEYTSSAEITLDRTLKREPKICPHKDISYDLFFKKLIESSPIFQESQAYKFAFSCESLNGEQLFQAHATLPHSGRPFMGTQTVDMFNKKRSPHSTKSTNNRQKSKIRTQKSTRPHMYPVPIPAVRTRNISQTGNISDNNGKRMNYPYNIQDHYQPTPLTQHEQINSGQKSQRETEQILQVCDPALKYKVEKTEQENETEISASSNASQTNSKNAQPEFDEKGQIISFDHTPFIGEEIISLTSSDSDKSGEPVALSDINFDEPATHEETLRTDQHVLYVELENSGQLIDSHLTEKTENINETLIDKAKDNKDENALLKDKGTPVEMNNGPLASNEKEEISESQVQASSPSRAPRLVMTSCSENITSAVPI